jgi:hypothetical protein
MRIPFKNLADACANPANQHNVQRGQVNSDPFWGIP